MSGKRPWRPPVVNKKTPPNLFDASRDLYDACQVALIIINEAASARGVMYGDEKKAVEQIVLALREADGDIHG